MVACAAALPAAAAVTIDFRGVAFIMPLGPPLPDGTQQLMVPVESSAYDFGDLATEGFYMLGARFTLDPDTGVGAGDFAFLRSTYVLYGTFTSAASPSGFTWDYTVIGGTGVWEGWSGTGVGEVTILDPLSWPTVRTAEVGTLTLVPEPASALLMLLGGAALAGALRRPAGSAAPSAASRDAGAGP